LQHGHLALSSGGIIAHSLAFRRCGGEAGSEVRSGAPAEPTEPRHVQELARRAIRPRGVEHEAAGIADDIGHETGELGDRDVFAGADIDEFVVGIMLHEKHAGIGEVVDGHELAARAAGAPDHDLGRAGELRLVKAADQRSRHVPVLGMIIVARPIEVRRHDRDEIRAMLAAIGLDQLEARDLGDRVPLVGRLERAGQEGVLSHGLARVARIDAGRSQKQQLLDAGRMGGPYHVELDRKIVDQEIDRKGIVGRDPADLAGGQEYGIWLHLGEPTRDVVAACEIERGVCRAQQHAVFRAQPTRDRGADHAPVPGNIDALALRSKSAGNSAE